MKVRALATGYGVRAGSNSTGRRHASASLRRIAETWRRRSRLHLNKFSGTKGICIMKTRNTGQHHITRRIRLIACMSALGTALIIALPPVAHAQHVTPPSVPGTLKPLEGNEA